MKSPIRLHMSEMPWPPPEGVVAAASMELKNINRYADAVALDTLKTLLAEYTGVGKEHIIPGTGSDNLLREAILTCAGGRTVIMVSPSFLPTVKAAGRAAGKRVFLRLRPPDFTLQAEALLEELTEPALVIIDSPNNPSGSILLERRTVETILKKPDTLLVVDEAYYEFSGQTCADLVEDYPNLAVSRTMDKCFSLAGLRVGYLLAGGDFIKVLSSFPTILPRPSLAAATAALKVPDYMKDYVARIIRERDRVKEQLIRLGVEAVESSANFLLLPTGMPDITRLLKERGILVADVSDQLGPGYIRIGIGTPNNNDALLVAMKSILSF